MKKIATKFKTYDADGFVYSTRFAFVLDRDVIKECIRLFNETDDIAKVVAWDSETNERVTEWPQPKKHGGYRPDSGRKTIDGLKRPHRHTITCNDRIHRIFKEQACVSDFVSEAVEFYVKNKGD